MLLMFYDDIVQKDSTRSSRARHGAPQGSTGERPGSPCAANDFPLPTHIRNREPGTKYTTYVRSGRARSHHDRGPSPDILPRNRAQAPGPASPPESWSPSECRIVPTISPRSLVISMASHPEIPYSITLSAALRKCPCGAIKTSRIT